MAINIVQKIPTGSAIAETTGDQSSLSVTLGTTTTSGNRLVAVWANYHSSTPTVSVSDSGSHAWTTPLSVGPSGFTRVYMAFTTGVITGRASHQITFTSGGAACQIKAGVFEISGLGSGTLTPATNSGTGNSTSVSSGAVSPSGTNLYIGFFGDNGGSTITPTWSGASQQWVHTYYECRSYLTTGSQTATWTLGTTDNWAAEIMAFVEDAGGRNPVSMGFDLR
jgi:hypothetical protein